ncbi:MAG: tetratricopeptide repeat protein [Dehalococcoidia bacterium]
MPKQPSIHFIVDDGYGGTSSEWIVSVRDDDVYVMNSALRGIRKVSLHGTRWHEAFDTTFRAPEGAEVEGRGSVRWLRPPELIDGLLLAFRIIVPTSELDKPGKSASAATVVVSSAPAGGWCEFQVWLARDGVVADAEWPGIRSPKRPTAFVGRRRLSDQREVYVTYTKEVPSSERNWVSDQVILMCDAAAHGMADAKRRWGQPHLGSRGIGLAHADDGSGVYVDFVYRSPWIPDSQRDWLYLADLRAKARMFDLAVRGYEAAMKLGEVPPTVELNRATCLLALGEKDAAYTALTVLVEEQPGLIQARLNRGGISILRGDDEGALTDFEAVIEASPTHFEGLHNKGVILLRASEPREALEALDRAIGVRSTDADTHRARARALWSLNEPDAAEAAARRAVECNPNDGRTHLTLGQILVSRGKYQEASDVLGDANWLRVGTNGLVAKAKALAGIEVTESVLQLVDGILAEAPNNVEAKELRPLLLASLDRHEEAISAIDELLTAAPDRSSVLVLKVSALIELNRADEALAVARALAAERSGPLVSLALADALLESGNPQGALDTLTRVHDVGEVEAGIEFVRACALSALGDFEPALQSLAAAVDLGFTSSTYLGDEPHFQGLLEDETAAEAFYEIVGRISPPAS